MLGPAAEALPAGVTRLIVVPDGPLHRVAFDALRLPDGRLAVERWAIGLAPSAAVATVLRRVDRVAPAGKAAEPRLLALGDPAFAREHAAGLTREGDLFRGAFDATGGLPRLAASGDEARDVARYAAGSEVRLRGDASEAWLKRARVDRFRVIHLATHALVDENSLARTSLALAPGAGEDGFLSPADLSALKLDADLVVLSACRTAGGVVVSGEGLQGLTTPLIEAGARSVIATQWRIGDRSTVRLVRDLYDALASGAPVAEALREAKLAAIGRGAPASEWAGFTVVGDPLARVRLHAPRPRLPLGWLAAACAVVLLAGGYLATRRSGRRAERSVRASDVVARTHQRYSPGGSARAACGGGGRVGGGRRRRYAATGVEQLELVAARAGDRPPREGERLARLASRPGCTSTTAPSPSPRVVSSPPERSTVRPMPTASRTDAASAAGMNQARPAAPRGTALDAGSFDRPQQVEVAPAVVAAHHVIERGEPRLLRALAPHERGDGLGRRVLTGRAGGPAGHGSGVQLSQTFVAHDASSARSQPTPISVKPLPQVGQTAVQAGSGSCPRSSPSARRFPHADSRSGTSGRPAAGRRGSSRWPAPPGPATSELSSSPWGPGAGSARATALLSSSSDWWCSARRDRRRRITSRAAELAVRYT